MRTLFAALLALTPAFACSCAGPSSPCSAATGSAVIFVAQVLTDSGDGWGKGDAKVLIVEALRGVPPGLKEASVSTMAGTSCYHRLKAGERYVILTSATNYGVGGCNPSFNLRGNEHILDAIRAQVKGELPRLVGKVLKSTAFYAQGGVIPNASIVLERGGTEHSTTSDAEGRFTLTGLDAGHYRIRVSKDGYVPDDVFNNRWTGRWVKNEATHVFEPAKERPGEIELGAKGCEVRDLSMWPSVPSAVP